MEILDQYVRTVPSIQNSLDVFKGEWASKLPQDLSSLNAGQSTLFEDARIQWAAEQFGGFEAKTILELGPLEAGHSYMLEQLGAASITAIEANTRAYLKCLIIKEILDLKHSHFLLGDAVEYLKQQPKRVDVCIASGILYHMKNPAELIYLISEISDSVFLWTHYYDNSLIESDARLSSKFSSEISLEYKGFQHTVHMQEYGQALGFSGFCGGSLPFSCWMTREDIISCLKFFGLKNIRIDFDHPHHPNGPSFAVAASRF
jgi:hypothetical protein